MQVTFEIDSTHEEPLDRVLIKRVTPEEVAVLRRVLERDGCMTFMVYEDDVKVS